MGAHTVSTVEGDVRGRDWGAGAAFLGIPFAEPPAGALRFMPPRSTRWDGVRECTAFGATPPQAESPWLQPASGIDEDCLHLNVWTPSVEGDRPVLVWVYGGGFEGGTAATEMISPRVLGETGELVIVSLNYRVGFLGFGAQGDDLPSNLGVRDVIAALEWVQRNIRAFGGDPARVTVMGESAGGFIAAALMGVVGADRLCRSLILMSGAASRLVPMESTEQLTAAWMRHLGADDVDALRGRSWQELVAAQGPVIPRDIGVRNAARVQALGVTDDSASPHGVLSMHPMQGAVAGPGAAMRLLVTATNAEIAMFRQFAGAAFAPASSEALVDEVASWGVSADRAASIVAAYASGVDDLGVVREHLLTDWIYRMPAARLAQARAGHAVPAYLAEIRGADGAPLGHAGDVRFAFTPAEAFDDAAERAHAAALQSALIRFAVDGDPGWAPHALGGDAAVIAGGVQVQQGVFDHALQRWEGVARS